MKRNDGGNEIQARLALLRYRLPSSFVFYLLRRKEESKAAIFPPSCLKRKILLDLIAHRADERNNV